MVMRVEGRARRVRKFLDPTGSSRGPNWYLRTSSFLLDRVPQKLFFLFLLPVVIIEMYNREIEEILVNVRNHFYLHDQYAKNKFLLNQFGNFLFLVFTKKNLWPKLIHSFSINIIKPFNVL